MPYINVDEAYILDNTGLQVDQSVDYANANSNRNLLDNPWWGSGHLVNQREVASMTHNAYGIDRWKCELNSATLTVSSGGMVFQGTSADLYQPMEDDLLTYLSGKTLTASVLYSDGTIESGSGTYTKGSKCQFILNPSTGADIFLSGAGNLNVRYGGRSTAITVSAVKLEIGAYSTLVNDSPPNYYEELDKCRYYFERVKPNSHVTLGWGYSEGNNTTYFSTVIHPKRTVPSIPAYSLAVSGTTSMSIGTTGLNIYSFAPTGHTTIRFLAAAGSFTSGSLYRCGILANGYIDFSADL